MALVFAAIFGFNNFNSTASVYAASEDMPEIRGATYEDFNMDTYIG